MIFARIFLTAFLPAMLMAFAASAQRFGYIDSRKIVEQLPEFKTAQQQLDQMAGNWQSELEKAQQQVTSLRKQMAAEEILMAPEMRKYQLQKIREKEVAARQIQEKYFGYAGELFKKRYELMQPVQEKVMALIKKMCRKNRLEMVFDKASNILIIYANTRHNFNSEVIKLMKPQEEETEEEAQNGQPGQAEKDKPVPASRLGYIESSAILEKMPQYHEVVTEMERLSKRWEKAVDQQRDAWKELEAAYEEEKMLLTEDMKAQRLEEVDAAKAEYLKLNNELFGPEGLIFTRRMELVKPLQDKVFEATKKVAEEKLVDFIFDKTADISMAWANPVHNYSDYVLEEMELGDPADTVR